MASAFDTEFLADAAPDLFTTYGESVTHRPLNKTANDATVTVIWIEQEPEQSLERGEETKRRAEVSVLDSAVTLHRDDAWLKGSEVWAAIGEPMAAEGGMRKVIVERRETVSRRAGGGGGNIL